MVLFIVLIFLRKAKKAANEAVELNKRLAEKQRDLEKALVQAESANEAKTTSLSFQAEADGLTITGEHDDYTGVNVWSNALYLKKILMNLFSNSMKYNKPNGSISMSMRTVERTEECITCEFKIQDTGVGMSEEFIQKGLFTPFAQEVQSARSSYRGTGLGMSIVKQLVEKMGGTLSIESELGEGSCFTVVLPFKINTEANSEEHKVVLDADIKGLRILLAEDNELNMEIAEFVLQNVGADVTKAWNGQEAVELFRKSEPGGFDIILMDIMMPVMNGYEATKMIRSLDREDAKEIPIIAMTANAFTEDRIRAKEAGMDEHVAKPIDVELLIKVIHKLVK